MRKLRRFWSDVKLQEIYGHTYKHERWAEHAYRVQHTLGVAHRLVENYGLKTAADLSSGDGAIIDQLSPRLTRVEKGDISVDGCGIEVNIKNLRPVDLFICTETIEHLEAPWTVLEEVAQRTRWLILSCPLDERPEIDNYEHYWSFTSEDVRDILTQSGFSPVTYDFLTGVGWTYDYQVWTARTER